MKSDSLSIPGLLLLQLLHQLSSTGNRENVTTGRLPAALPVPGREYVAGDGGVVSYGDVAAFEAHLLEGEAKGQQIGTHSQEELQQEAAEEVVLSLCREDKETIGCVGVRLPLSRFQLIFCCYSINSQSTLMLLK